MIFNLMIKGNDNKIVFSQNSSLVKFFIDDNKNDKLLKNFFETLNIPFSKLQVKTFLNKNNNELTLYNSSDKPAVIYLRKIIIDKEFNSDFFRNYFSGLLPTFQNKGLDNIHIIVPSFKKFEEYFKDEKHFISSFIEGLYLGNYSFGKYKSDKNKPSKLWVNIHYGNQKLVDKEIKSTKIVMDAVFFTRDLVNEPAITLTPTELAGRVKREVKHNNIKVEIFDKKELKKRRMNAVLAVGDASENPPCMIVMYYKPRLKPKKKIALVGKGVTFDSGGLSIKTTAGMIDMNGDMAGGALVIGVIKAAASLNLPVELIGIVPAVENMVSGKSFKPGDIIKSASGKTIEVKDTDAEGRLILADALHFASEQKPDEIIDFATLTGACVVALGEIAAGLFTQNNKLADDLMKSGLVTYERLWRMPFWNDYKRMIKSEIADISNLGPRWGGAITAGKFLEHFVDEKIPWAHIDIAGPAMKHKSTNYTEKYATGFGVRLIIDYLLQK